MLLNHGYAKRYPDLKKMKRFAIDKLRMFRKDRLSFLYRHKERNSKKSPTGKKTLGDFNVCAEVLNKDIYFGKYNGLVEVRSGSKWMDCGGHIGAVGVLKKGSGGAKATQRPVASELQMPEATCTLVLTINF